MSAVLLYARLSASKEESVSIERQLQAGRQYAAARGWTVAGEFTDDGVSATKNKPEDRAGWRALLEAAGQTKPHAVIVWKVDRLARSVLDFLHADAALRERGSGLVAVEDPIDMTTAQGRGFATMLAVFAEMEAAGIAARVRDARRALLHAGRRAGGRPPYGFRNVKNPEGPGYVLAQDPETIGYVRCAVERAQRGDSIYSIARWFEEAGAPRRVWGKAPAKPWSDAAVETILRSPALAGLTPFDPNRRPGSKANPWAVVRDDDGLPVVDESVAILTIEERRALLDALDARLRPGSRPQQGKTPTLLSKALTCGSCGSVMHRSTSGGGFKGYRCGNRQCPAQASVNQQRAEEFVIEAVLTERGETRFHEVTEHKASTADLARIEEALRSAGAALATTDDEAEEERLRSRIASLKTRRAEARSTAVPVTTKRIVTPTRGQRSWGEEFEAALAEESPEGTLEAARLLREQVASITVHPSGQNAHTALADRVDIEFVPVADHR